MRKLLMFFLSLALMAGMAQAATPFVFNGDGAVNGEPTPMASLDGNWDHNNGSDQWDGSAIGAGAPGGVSALTEGTTDFIRIQDTGDPRDYGIGDPSNRKLYFAHQIDFGLDGAHLEFRARIATDAPLDMQHPDGTLGIAPWPAGGIGSAIRDNGKAMFGIAEDDPLNGGGCIGFSLANQEELANYAGYENITTDVLLLNEYNPADQDQTNTGETGTPSYVPVNDATQWHTFVVDIASLGGTEYQLSISIDGAPAVTRDVTSSYTGGQLEYEGIVQYHVHMGSSSTGAQTAFDVDYYKGVPEPMTLSLLGLGGLALLRRRR